MPTAVKVIPVRLPLDLVDQSPGNLDPSLLVSIHPRGKLHHLAADAWRASVAACGQIGLPLTWIYGGMYRTAQGQLDLWYRRWTTEVQHHADGSETDRRFWDGRWWWLKPGAAPSGTPGSSWHERGLAVDCAYDTDPLDGLNPEDAGAIIRHPKWDEFVPLMLAHGWSWENRPTAGSPGGREPWHVRYIAGDRVPQPVKDWKAGAVAQLPPFDPGKRQWSIWPVVHKSAAKRGDTGDRVKYLQGVLKALGYTIVIDGRFGPATERVVRQYQSARHLTVDGWVGDQTWTAVDADAITLGVMT